MKKIILLISLFVFTFYGISFAEEKKQEIRFCVGFSVVYNSVSAEKAEMILKQLLALHKEGCQVNYNIQKVNFDRDITASDGLDIYVDESNVRDDFTLESR